MLALLFSLAKQDGEEARVPSLLRRATQHAGVHPRGGSHPQEELSIRHEGCEELRLHRESDEVGEASEGEEGKWDQCRRRRWSQLMGRACWYQMRTGPDDDEGSWMNCKMEDGLCDVSVCIWETRLHHHRPRPRGLLGLGIVDRRCRGTGFNGDAKPADFRHGE